MYFFFLFVSLPSYVLSFPDMHPKVIVCHLYNLMIAVYIRFRQNTLYELQVGFLTRSPIADSCMSVKDAACILPLKHEMCGFGALLREIRSCGWYLQPGIEYLTCFVHGNTSQPLYEHTDTISTYCFAQLVRIKIFPIKKLNIFCLQTWIISLLALLPMTHPITAPLLLQYWIVIVLQSILASLITGWDFQIQGNYPG